MGSSDEYFCITSLVIFLLLITLIHANYYYTGSSDELLSEAICCDDQYRNYAEPNGFFKFPDIGESVEGGFIDVYR